MSRTAAQLNNKHISLGKYRQSLLHKLAVCSPTAESSLSWKLQTLCCVLRQILDAGEDWTVTVIKCKDKTCHQHTKQ